MLTRKRAVTIPPEPDPAQAKKAIELLETAAERGSFRAMMRLAELYSNGFHTAADPVRVSQFLNAAIAQGSPHAQLWAAKFRLHQKKYEDARRLFEEIAKPLKYGDVDQKKAAHEGLAELYLKGLGVQQNFETAAKHFLAAQLHDDGDGDARKKSRGPRVVIRYRLDDFDRRYIIAIQQQLARYGSYNGEVDGRITRDFKRALFMFPFLERHFAVDSIYEDFGARILEWKVTSLIRDENTDLRNWKAR